MALNHCSKTPYFSVMSSVEGKKERKPKTEFEMLFDLQKNKLIKVDGDRNASLAHSVYIAEG